MEKGQREVPRQHRPQLECSVPRGHEQQHHRARPSLRLGHAHLHGQYGDQREHGDTIADEEPQRCDVEYLDGSDAALTDADSVEDGFQIALAAGPNIIKVKVTAAGGDATQTYQVTVTRLPLLALEQVNYTFDEADGDAELTATLSPACGGEVTVD